MFFFPTYFTLYNRLQFHPSHQNWFKWILFNGWVILHCVYAPQVSYPFICWWTSRLFPCPGYYKQCCDEHWGTRVSFNSAFLSVYAQLWDCWAIWQFYFQLLKESPHVWRSLVGCSPWGSQRVGHDWATSLSLSCIGEGNGNPLQSSCLENPRDEGAWWAAVYGVTQSRTRLKWLSSSTLFSIGVVLICIPTNSVRGFPFLHTLSSIYCL